jgi:mannose-6-phosphate isomerase-like protein (cupin superfamily)
MIMADRRKRRRRKPVFLPPGGGRSYPMGRLAAIFKADNEETGRAYSVSEWWLEPNTKGPGAHTNDEDHVWYVIEGAMSVLIDRKWIDAPRGSFVLIPAGVLHNFENRSRKRAGILNFNSSAGFEDKMPGMLEWFAKNPAGDARSRARRR